MKRIKAVEKEDRKTLDVMRVRNTFEKILQEISVRGIVWKHQKRKNGTTERMKKGR